MDRGGEFTSVEFAAYCRALLAATKWRGGAAEPDDGVHGSKHDEGVGHMPVEF
jgi:hypothetical protein